MWDDMYKESIKKKLLKSEPIRKIIVIKIRRAPKKEKSHFPRLKISVKKTHQYVIDVVGPTM